MRKKFVNAHNMAGLGLQQCILYQTRINQNKIIPIKSSPELLKLIECNYFLTVSESKRGNRQANMACFTAVRFPHYS